MPRRVLGLALGCVVFSLATRLDCHTSPVKEPTITSSTELVLIPTVVTDKSGNHIFGLKSDAFVLKQDGKPQHIAIFEEVKTDTARVHRSEGQQGRFTNYDSDGNDHHRLSIIVLDFLNTPASDQANARNALLRLLTEVADSDQPMCLLALSSSGLNLLHDFTDDPKLLAAALNKAKSSTPMIYEGTTDPHHPADGPLAAAITRMIRGDLRMESQLASLETKQAANLTMQALEQIAKAFRGLPGRKSLIWASSGFPFSLSPMSSSGLTDDMSTSAHRGGEMYSVYDNLWKMMNDAQIAIYSVDLRSSTVDLPMSTGGVRPSDAGDPQFDIELQAKVQRAESNSTLKSFAENTGGKAFLGGNNLTESFRQAIQDDSNYYMLGYYVGRNSTKPGWHTLAITSSTKGARIRSRRGFLLTSDTSPASAEQDIHLALTSPLDFTGVPISITWLGKESGQVSDKSRTRFELEIPAGFASVDETDNNHMLVDIAVSAKSSNGNTAGDISQRIDTHLNSDALAQIQQHGMTYRNGLRLPPGEYTVRFVVRDSLRNRMGSVAAPVKVAADTPDSTLPAH